MRSASLAAAAGASFAETAIPVATALAIGASVAPAVDGAVVGNSVTIHVPTTTGPDESRGNGDAGGRAGRGGAGGTGGAGGRCGQPGEPGR